MKKHRTRALALLAGIALGAPGCALGAPAFANDSLPSAVRAWLSERREIVFACQETSPPFAFVDGRTGEYTGMSVELIRWIATEFGFTATFKPLPLEAAHNAVLRGSADALSGLFRRDAKAARFDFSASVFESPSSIYARSDRADIGGLEDLGGKRVATRRGDYAVEYLSSRDASIELVYADDIEEALALVASGDADALVGDDMTARYYLDDPRFRGAVRKVTEALYVGQNRLAVAKGDTLLLAALDAGIAKARSSGTIDTIFRKWTGAPIAAPPKRTTGSLVLALAISGAVVAAAAGAGWSRARASVRDSSSALASAVVELRAENERLAAANARLRLDLEERSRLEEDKRRIDAEAAARRVEELTRCAIAKALDSTGSAHRET